MFGMILLAILAAFGLSVFVVFVPLMYRTAADTFARERFQLAWLPFLPRRPP